MEDILVPKKQKLKIIPLGGLNEIGKNMTVFEYGDDIFVVDCGIAFPDDDMPGIDLVIPDTSYLEKNIERVRGVVITHGHEDHIGALPFFLKKVNVPVYATKLTIGLIETKLKEHNILSSAKLNRVKPGDSIKIGRSFMVEFIHSNHSIAGSVALAIKTPVGTVVHTGDFKIDSTPIDGEMIDLTRLGELGREGVLLLMSDSTNVERAGYTMSERSVGSTFDEIFKNCEKRIIVATFASNVHRVQQIINTAAKYGRKVAVSGRSMENIIEVAILLGYMTIPEKTLISIDDINRYNDNQLVIVTTGSQGEAMSALFRMAYSDHRKVELTRNDLIIVSASPIPGNEKTISRVINELFKQGTEVIYESLAEVHVSGHACQEELKLMLALTKPKYFMPVHGEYRHLHRHSQLGTLMGVEEKNVFIMENGRVLELDEKGAKMTTTVPSGKLLVDGLGVGDVGNIVLRDRKHLSNDGLIVCVVSISADNGEIVAGPDIISRGFVYVREAEELMEEARQVTKEALDACVLKGATDWNALKLAMKNTLSDYMYEKTKRSPMILPVIMEV
ncbi:MAG: ribonuclease J [Ruminococcaceae bacterium]|nr:ribonuclease J [Oscillospiraceae bacterium]